MMEKLFVFHGIDHKVGTTMVAQSVAEYLSKEYDELRILMMSLNGRESAEYVRETPESIETIKLNLDNKILSSGDFMKACKRTDSLYMLGGVLNEAEGRFYQPDSVAYLVGEVASEFHIIIIDSGNEIDNGLAVGSLQATENRFLLLTQQESVLKRFEKHRVLYEKMNILFPHFIINKYDEQDPYGIDYIAKRLGISKQQFLSAAAADQGRRAEMDYKTLLEYRSAKYNQSINRIAEVVLEAADIPIHSKQRKSRWKSFI